MDNSRGQAPKTARVAVIIVNPSHTCMNRKQKLVLGVEIIGFEASFVLELPLLEVSL